MSKKVFWRIAGVVKGRSSEKRFGRFYGATHGVFSEWIRVRLSKSIFGGISNRIAQDSRNSLKFFPCRKSGRNFKRIIKNNPWRFFKDWLLARIYKEKFLKVPLRNFWSYSEFLILWRNWWKNSRRSSWNAIRNHPQRDFWRNLFGVSIETLRNFWRNSWQIS